MAFIVKNDYDAIFFDPLDENGTILKVITMVAQFVGVPDYVIRFIIRFSTMIKMVVYLFSAIFMLVLVVFMLLYRPTHLVLFFFIALINAYYMTTAYISPI
jgi:nitrate/nitrite-specific signal transduction histidine kinase